MSHSQRRGWTYDELLLVMNLYCHIPFGRQHSRAKDVIELAQCLGRTPGSVAMKLNNFTSLDPEEAARGVRGLPGASALDRKVWEAFHRDWEGMAAQSESLWERIVDKHEGAKAAEAASEENTFDIPRKPHEGPTESERVTRVRHGQDFFRRAVMAAYNARCCVSGNPVPEFLIASHILPWAKYPEERVNPKNGLCLSRLHDAAFDKGLITFDEQKRLVLSKSLREYLSHDSIKVNFERYEGKPIITPEKFAPEPSFLKTHREDLFQG